MTAHTSSQYNGVEGGDAMADPTTPWSTRAARALLIVPAAHYRVLDASFQAEMYELFHTRTGSRVGHMLCTPVVMFGLMLALGHAPGDGWRWALPVALSAVVTAWGFRVDRVAGAVMVPLLAAVMLAARAVGASVPSPAAMGAAIAVGGALLQTMSHGFEDVPPPISGLAGWMPMRVWLAKVPVWFVAAWGALTVGLFTWLELWASPRVWPLQVLHLLMGAGYRPELRAALTARVDDIFAHPERAWREPQTADALAR